MFRRVAWFGAGALSAVWAQRKARRVAQRFTPPAIATSAVGAAKARGRTVAAALQEGRSAMRDREAELRAGLSTDPATDPAAEGPGASIHTLTPRTTVDGEPTGADPLRAERRRGDRRKAPGPPT